MLLLGSNRLFLQTLGMGAALGLGACSGSTEATGRNSSGTRGDTADSASAAGSTNASGGVTTTGLSTGNTGVINMTTGTTGGVNACQEFEVTFTPDIPTVMILVDRSSSMWDNQFWDPLRDGVLEVVERLHQDVRFGFATFTGIQGQTCPLDLANLGIIDLNNYQAIADFYTPIVHPGVATETPTAAAIQDATALLQADNQVTPGPKFILLVTDGNPDYCDSGQVECRADTLVKQLQNAHAAGIQTFVVALPDPGINQEWLTAFANAGVGQPVRMVQETKYCAAVPAPSTPLFPEPFPQATFSPTMGTATHFSVDPAQREDLVQQLAGLVAGVKSCTFDLAAELEIVPGLENQGTVSIETTTPTGETMWELQPYDATGTNGWKVNNGTQVELVGQSCAKLRSPDTTGIDFGFPCEIVIPK